MNLVCTVCITDELHRQDKELGKGDSIILHARDSQQVVTIYNGNALCEQHFGEKLSNRVYRYVACRLTGPDRKN